MRSVVRKIVSGGQTGVDRAALDVAIALRIPHGGWCPAGRRAEDGRIPRRYRLRETPSPAYQVRTARNVAGTDATLLLCDGTPTTGGTARVAAARRKPLLIVDLADPLPPREVRSWLATNRVAILNVAGPRESTEPGVYARAASYLRTVLTRGNSAVRT
jgi:hypothetical protein